MISPQTLDKEERIWTYGLIIEPTAEGNYVDGEIFAFQPTLGYRTGIRPNHELGINLYGILTPGFTIDWKHKYFEKDNFILTGDLAGFTGLIRPSGFQYDLLFGNRSLYGVAGMNYEINKINSDKPSIVLGIGSDFNKYTKVGFQISLMKSLPGSFSEIYGDRKAGFMTISIGVKFDFLKIKKRYRD